MTIDNHQRHNIPRSAQSFHFSRPIIGLLVATLILGIVLVYSTLQNINRAQSLMEKFLQDKGETIMRAVEAGSRTTMRHHMGSGDPLHTLLTEYAKNKDIRFIDISNAEGKILRHIGEASRVSLTKAELSIIFATDTLITKQSREDGLFYLAKIFQADPEYPRMNMHSMHMGMTHPGQTEKKILSIGLLTEQFDLARKQDVRHAILMGAIIFLVGTAGLYFLFLYQKVRLTSSNLADMKLYTENIIESIPVAIITLDAENNIVSCNKNTEELFGHQLAEIQGKNISDAIPNCTSLNPETCSSLFGYEHECISSSGKLIPLRTNCSPLVDNEGENIGKVLILRDMSAIKDMEIQLERSRRMAALGKMAAGIAHEIRNPLGTLRGFAQFFGNQPESSEESKDYSRLMISEIDRLNQTVSGLLQFSRPRVPEPEHLQIDNLFSKTVSMMAADFASKNIGVKIQENTSIALRADPDLLLQVLMNLLKNSVNSTSYGGEISLECEENEFTVTITVTDNGCGMSEEIREKMFDPFFTTNRSGTGLGLAVSHQIIEQHGGSFEVQTTSGHGTSISVHLPK